MLAPPVEAGPVKVTVAWVLPAVATPMVGAPGTVALTANVCETVGAAFHVEPPAWSASIVHEPAATKVSAPPDVTVQTPVVLDENVTASPDVADAFSVGAVPKF
jgi:hypothetical protein